MWRSSIQLKPVFGTLQSQQEKTWTQSEATEGRRQSQIRPQFSVRHTAEPGNKIEIEILVHKEGAQQKAANPV